MSTELQRTPTQPASNLTVWHKTEEIRKMFAPKLTDIEFSLFIGLGQNLGANPFTREIWAIKYKPEDAAAIFLGRDFYRRKAQEQPDYDGHAVDTVYENDTYKVINGIPQHEYNLKSRGNLLGAYCVVYKKGQKQPYYVYAELKEYTKPFGNWKTMPATMIKKVAEAQGLRGAYQGVFAGTYDESEQWQSAEVVQPAPVSQPVENVQMPEPTQEQLDELMKKLLKNTPSELLPQETKDIWWDTFCSMHTIEDAKNYVKQAYAQVKEMKTKATVA